MSKKLPVAITEEEFYKVIESTKNNKHKIAYLLGFASGLRISEILHLQKEDIDLLNKTILVKQGKGGKDRVVPLAKGFKSNMINQIPFNISVRALQIAFKKSCQKSGVLALKPTIHFHSLRHGFATQLVSHNVPIHHIRTLLGHSNISTTNIYLEANPKEALKSYENLF